MDYEWLKPAGFGAIILAAWGFIIKHVTNSDCHGNGEQIKKLDEKLDGLVSDKMCDERVKRIEQLVDGHQKQACERHKITLREITEMKKTSADGDNRIHQRLDTEFGELKADVKELLRKV